MEAMLLFVGSWPFAFLPPLPVISAPVWLVFGFGSLIALTAASLFFSEGVYGKVFPLTTPSGGCGWSRYFATDGRAKKKAKAGLVCVYPFLGVLLLGSHVLQLPILWNLAGQRKSGCNKIHRKSNMKIRYSYIESRWRDPGGRMRAAPRSGWRSFTVIWICPNGAC
jgi:hypothetical protein